MVPQTQFLCTGCFVVCIFKGQCVFYIIIYQITLFFLYKMHIRSRCVFNTNIHQITFVTYRPVFMSCAIKHTKNKPQNDRQTHIAKQHKKKKKKLLFRYSLRSFRLILNWQSQQITEKLKGKQKQPIVLNTINN